ncbi:MAG: hypothetical protein AAF738_07055 [Bacteroidota bacterium]
MRPSPTVSRQVERQLQTDAARLCLRANETDLRHADVRISASQQKQFYQLLRSIYQFDQRLLDCYRIQTANIPSTDHLRLIYKRDVDWANPLEHGISSTEHPLINGILTRYDLVIENHIQLNTRQDALTLRSVNPINMTALASQLNTIEGVEAVDFSAATPLRSDIHFKQLRQGWEFEYILHTEEDSSRRWLFRIDESGKVHLEDESGADLPSWLSCE